MAEPPLGPPHVDKGNGLRRRCRIGIAMQTTGIKKPRKVGAAKLVSRETVTSPSA
jgi:hypothetical protein